jgi:hypothetical protein
MSQPKRTTFTVCIGHAADERPNYDRPAVALADDCRDDRVGRFEVERVVRASSVRLAMPTERRARRVATDLPAEVLIECVESFLAGGTVVNLSATGALCRMDCPADAESLEVGALVQLCFSVPGVADPVLIDGYVPRRAQNGLAIAFVDMSRRDRALLDSFCFSVLVAGGEQGFGKACDRAE